MAIIFVEDCLVELHDIEALISIVQERFLRMLDIVLLFLHLGEDRFGRTKLSGESLEGDARSVIEGFEVRWCQIAALVFPSFIVDGASFKETLRGVFIQKVKGCD